MGTSYQRKKDNDLLVGINEQNKFAKYLKFLGYTTFDYSIIDDFNHIDNGVIIDNVKYVFDFKGSKKAHSEGMTWIEIRSNNFNPQTGRFYKGWLYSKNINSIVLELPNKFVLYDLIKIREYVDSIRDKMTNTYTRDKSKLTIYQLYRRQDKNDISFLIPLKDIENYKICEFVKDLGYYNWYKTIY